MFLLISDGTIIVMFGVAVLACRGPTASVINLLKLLIFYMISVIVNRMFVLMIVKMMLNLLVL